MTGAEHYREAERLLLSCQVAPSDDDDPATYPAFEVTEVGGGLVNTVNSIANALAAAQVHAVLAVAAQLAGPA